MMSEGPRIGDTVVIDWGGGIYEVEVYDVNPNTGFLMVWVPLLAGGGEVLEYKLYNVPPDVVTEIKAA